MSGARPGTHRTAPAYNLAVADIHTYHVGAGSILVHNICEEVQRVANNIAEHANARGAQGGGTHFVRGVAPDELADYVARVLDGQVANVEVRYGLRNGRTAYWDPGREAMIIEDGPGGSVYTPRRGKTDFDRLK